MKSKRSSKNVKAVSWLMATIFICASLLTMAMSPNLQRVESERTVTIKVTSTEDVIADDGLCTLREAVISANTNQPSGEQSGECPAGQDNVKDIIILAGSEIYPLSIENTIVQDVDTQGDLDIWNNSAETDLIIGVEGGGAATISQDAEVADRVLHILGATVKMAGLVIKGGNTTGDGGGIHLMVEP